MAPQDSQSTSSSSSVDPFASDGDRAAAPESPSTKRARHDNDKKSDRQDGRDENEANLASPGPSISVPLSIARISETYRDVLDEFLRMTPAELEEATAALFHKLSLVSEAKALTGIPGGKLEKFILFRKFPLEIKRKIWGEAMREEQQLFIIEAYRTGTFWKRIVQFRYLSKPAKPNALLEVCDSSRTVALEHQSAAVGPGLPGFKGVVHLNGDNDIVILRNYHHAFSTDVVMKGVKNVVIDGGPASLHTLSFAAALKKMFPDLRCWFLIGEDEGDRMLRYYVNNLDDCELVPKDTVSVSKYPVTADGWPQLWAEMEADLEEKTPCPEVKMMKVVRIRGK